MSVEWEGSIAAATKKLNLTQPTISAQLKVLAPPVDHRGSRSASPTPSPSSWPIASCGPTVIEDDIQSQYGVRVAGRLPAVRERFYAVSAERKVKNPIVGAITSAARREAFEGGVRDRNR